MAALSFAELRRVNVARCVGSWNHPLDGWTPADWLIAMCGELGEALNLIKKLNRERDGLVGNLKGASQLVADLADELADTAIYLDLFMERMRAPVEEGTFADALDRGRAAFYGRGNASMLGLAAMSYAGELAESVRLRDVDASLLPAPILMAALAAVGDVFDIDLGEAVIAKFNRTSAKHGFADRLGIDN